jgi:hypothetical protein
LPSAKLIIPTPNSAVEQSTLSIVLRLNYNTGA